MSSGVGFGHFSNIFFWAQFKGYLQNSTFLNIALYITLSHKKCLVNCIDKNRKTVQKMFNFKVYFCPKTNVLFSSKGMKILTMFFPLFATEIACTEQGLFRALNVLFWRFPLPLTWNKKREGLVTFHIRFFFWFTYFLYKRRPKGVSNPEKPAQTKTQKHKDRKKKKSKWIKKKKNQNQEKFYPTASQHAVGDTFV